MRFQFRTPVAVVATAALAAGAAVVTLVAPSAGATSAVTEFPLSSATAQPVGIANGPDGNLWVAEAATNAIARVSPNGTFTEFSLPHPASAPPFITVGPNANLWFTERFGNRVGSITPAGTITEYALPTAGSGPMAITTGPDGNLWFTESLVDRVGRISPAGVVTEFAVPSPFSGLAGIATGPDGNVWFTESSAGKVGRITPTGVVTEFALPSTDSEPAAITAGPDGALWFAERTASKIGRVSTAGTVSEFPTASPGAQPASITTGPDHNLWFTEPGADRVGHLVPGGAITDEPVPTAAAGPADIALGPDGNLWFTETLAGAVAKLVPGADDVPLAPSLTVASNPNFAVEGGNDGAFVISRAGDLSSALSVSYAMTGTATSGADYTALATAVMPAGTSTLSVPVHALADNVADDGETVTMQLLSTSFYNVALPNSATVTITEHAPADPCANLSASSYTDRDKFDVFATDIDCVTRYGLAQGFNDGSFGPTLDLSRSQMASLVARLLVKLGVQFPATLTDVFPGDNAGRPHELSIDLLGSIGLFDGTTGERGDAYGVSEPMRRDDMAQLLVNAYKVITGTALPAASSSPFTDAANGGDPHGAGTDNAPAINALAQAGVVNGKTPTTYEPASTVSRGEFAAYFARFLRLVADAGHRIG